MIYNLVAFYEVIKEIDNSWTYKKVKKLGHYSTNDY